MSLLVSGERYQMSPILGVSTLLILYVAGVQGLQDVIRIGGLFHTMEASQELAFRYAAEMINADRAILSNHTLMTHYEKVPEHDSFQVSRTVCKLLSVGVAGIFGPQSGHTSDHVQSMCDTMDVPHVEMRWDMRMRRQHFLVNLYPHPATLSRAYADLVSAWGWKSFTLLYEDGEGLVRLADLLKFYSPSGYTVTVRQLHPETVNHRPTLRQVLNSGDKNIVLDCAIERLPEILKQALQVGLMVADMNFIITNLDMHTVDLESFQWSGTNITGVRLVDPQSMDVQLAIRAWSDREMRRGVILDITPDSLRLSTALVYDAVYLFAKALARLDSPSVEITPLDCSTDATWHHGSSLINFMKDGQSSHRGLTGLIQFDNEGFRSNIELDIVELTVNGLQKVGTWNSSEGLNLSRVQIPNVLDGKDQLHNMTFRVRTALSAPYGMLKESIEPLIGNERFEGFGIDLIHEISLMLGFNYTFDLQHDLKNGAVNKETGKWDGMVGALLDNEADLAITDLTITADRESAVDFTMPFMNLGISILYKKPTKEAPMLFSFLTTFSPGVWYYMLFAYTGVSLVMFITGRISPKEWNNPYPCKQNPDELENQFNLRNAFWFTIGSVMQQGSEIAPIGCSTRMVAGIWWFFTLIMVSTYKANLAAVLTVESMTSPFRSAEEMANQNVIKYGAKAGGSTAYFFRDSSNPVYQRMWTAMSTTPGVFTNGNDQGLNWVKSKNYAYLMESTSIEYITERDCEVTQIGGQLDAKGYGIAMRKNSTYRNDMNQAVLKLQETGKLTKLKNRWWKEARGGGACDKSGGGGKASHLNLDNLGGVFVVLLAGVSLAIVVTIFELVYHVSRTAIREKVSFRQLLVKELKFAARCSGSTKRVRKCNNCEDGDGDGELQDDFTPMTSYDAGFRAEAMKGRSK